MRGSGSRRWRLGLGVLTEAVGARLEVRLEDRFEHQLQRGLHDSVSSGRDAQATQLPVRLGDHLLPRLRRSEPSSLKPSLQPGEELLGTGSDGPRSDTINPGRACTLVDPDPVPRGDEERRIIDKVEQVIETAARITGRPLVQLGLHRAYPQLGLIQVGPRRAGVHQRPPRAASLLPTHWAPSPCPQRHGACDRLSRLRTTTGPPPHPGGVSRRRAFPPTSRMLAGRGTAGMVPTFTIRPFNG